MPHPPSRWGIFDWLIDLVFLAVLFVVVHFGLKYFWRVWKPDGSAEDRLSRAVAGAIAGALFLGAVLATQDKAHQECTQTVRTNDGTECVGDYVTVPGPDIVMACIEAFCGAMAMAISLRRPEPHHGPDG